MHRARGVSGRLTTSADPGILRFTRSGRAGLERRGGNQGPTGEREAERDPRRYTLSLLSARTLDSPGRAGPKQGGKGRWRGYQGPTGSLSFLPRGTIYRVLISVHPHRSARALEL